MLVTQGAAHRQHVMKKLKWDGPIQTVLRTRILVLSAKHCHLGREHSLLDLFTTTVVTEVISHHPAQDGGGVPNLAKREIMESLCGHHYHVDIGMKADRTHEARNPERTKKLHTLMLESRWMEVMELCVTR